MSLKFVFRQERVAMFLACNFIVTYKLRIVYLVLQNNDSGVRSLEGRGTRSQDSELLKCTWGIGWGGARRMAITRPLLQESPAISARKQVEEIIVRSFQARLRPFWLGLGGF